MIKLNGLGFALRALMKAALSALRAATLSWMPRLIFLSVMRAKKRAAWLSRDALAGVRRNGPLAPAMPREFQCMAAAGRFSAIQCARHQCRGLA
ncbi:MAG: hypothetical protein ACKOED_02725 [Aestuariivirga sp.]